MSITGRFDVAVTGSGFAGLAAAILLGRLGRRVVIVEAAPQVGGLVRSYVRGGLDCPVGVHYFGSAGPDELLGQLLRVLEVRDVASPVRVDPGGIIDRYVFDDFEFDLPANVDSLEASLHSRFPDASEGIRFLISALRTARDGLRIDPRGRVALSALSSESFGVDARTILEQRGCPEPLRRVVAVQGTLTGLMLHEASLEPALTPMASLLQSAWELGCTGSELADALLHRAVQYGAEVITGDPVERVEATGDIVQSLKLRSGQVVEADAFVSAIHPKLLVRMLPPVGLSEAFATYSKGLFAIAETPGVLCVVALVDAARHSVWRHGVYRMSGDVRSGFYAQIRPSTVPGHHRLVLMTRSEYADWQPWHATRTGRRGPDYVERKRSIARSLLRSAESVTGPLDDARLVDVWTPLTLRDWTGAPEGGTYGLLHSISAGYRFLSLTRTPLSNLMQVGQSALMPGLLGCTVGVIRAVGDLVGRPLLRGFLADQLHGAKGVRA